LFIAGGQVLEEDVAWLNAYNEPIKSNGGEGIIVLNKF